MFPCTHTPPPLPHPACLLCTSPFPKQLTQQTGRQAAVAEVLGKTTWFNSLQALGCYPRLPFGAGFSECCSPTRRRKKCVEWHHLKRRGSSDEQREQGEQAQCKLLASTLDQYKLLAKPDCQMDTND